MAKHLPEDAVFNEAARSVTKKPWAAPKISALGADQTLTTTIKWFTPDLHFNTSDYGTPPS